ncbi:MAG: hypothetical protein BWK76_20105 [Desulfobulbaceae bacterium A2]|nr:MAG: hypothetical protein BWK76_20105 [Desulfobulbaceae bacterium A2]
MGLLDRLLARLHPQAETVLEVLPRRCLRSRYRHSGCARCADECPAEALRFGPGQVLVDGRRCVACLACVAACPSGALVARDSRLDAAMRGVLSRDGPLECCCERGVRSGRELLLPCLGGLSLEHLAVLAACSGDVRLHLEHCRDCRAPQVSELLARRLARLQALVSQAGTTSPLPVQLITQARAEAGDAVTAPGSDHQADRRAYFRVVREMSRQAADEARGALREQAVLPPPPGEKQAPPRTVLLRQALETVDIQRRGWLLPLLHTLTVDESCTLCGACAGMCPTGALRNERDDQTKRLVFSWAACSGCGLCQDFCRPRSIQLSPGCPVADLAMDTITLVQREPA